VYAVDIVSQPGRMPMTDTARDRDRANKPRPAGLPLVVSVQYLRAVAAGLVVLHHALNIPALAPYYTRSFGTFGVDLFFVISGYIMWATTCDKNIGPAKFWLARVTRVVPLYWIFTTLFIAAALIVPGAMATAAIDPVHVVKSYLFIPAAHPYLGSALPTYTLGWTLNYEMFFYLIFGFCLLQAHRPTRLALLLGTLTLLVLIGLVAAPTGAVASTYTNPMLLEFAAGTLLAWVMPRAKGVSPLLGVVLLATAIAWLTGAYALDASPFVAHSVAAAAALAGALLLEPIARRKISVTGLFLGDASYSIYLAHPFGIRAWQIVFERLIGTGSMLAVAGCVLGAVVVGLGVGVASYLCVERPVLHALRRRERVARQEPAHAA
jgi:exopolysaccharide production protein ExoZ